MNNGIMASFCSDLEKNSGFGSRMFNFLTRPVRVPKQMSHGFRKAFPTVGEIGRGISGGKVKTGTGRFVRGVTQTGKDVATAGVVGTGVAGMALASGVGKPTEFGAM